jgi:hypothetical protein
MVSLYLQSCKCERLYATLTVQKDHYEPHVLVQKATCHTRLTLEFGRLSLSECSATVRYADTLAGLIDAMHQTVPVQLPAMREHADILNPSPSNPHGFLF